MKLQSFEGWKVYSFPADPQEQNQLKRVSSNKLKNELKDCDGNIEKTIDLCYKHFLLTLQRRKTIWHCTKTEVFCPFTEELLNGKLHFLYSVRC